MPKEIAILLVFQSESTPGKQYQTLVYTDGSASCECPAWKFKKKTTAGGARTCTHIRSYEAGMAEEHAVKVVRYAEVVAAPARPLPRVAIAGPTMTQADLSPEAAGRRRVFDFEMED